MAARPARSIWTRLAPLRRPVIALVVVMAMAAATRADAESSILHEFVAPDATEDVSFSATTLEGDLPAAVQTPSGLATAPDPRKAPGGDHVYSGATTDDSPDSTYEPDRDTRRPKIENYDDPFSPATAPFKRLRAYDWVDPDYALRVREKSLTALPVGGTIGAGDEPFYGDLSVDLLPDQPVRIPTVGPGARLLRLHANPEVPIEVFRDGADNWFVRGKDRVRVHLVVEIGIPRATFGSDFADVEWSSLDALGMGSRQHDAAAQQVEQAIGVSRAMRPREAVRKMVTYFRSFAPSNEPPTGKQDIYLDLALSKKGVCRHRAFAFLVTALSLGIPTRMVVNEAHAWVEVFDGSLWHRVDLGGAAANLDHEPDPGKPAYKPPPDPYAWPEGRDSGQDLADRNREQAASAQSGNNGNNGNNGTSSATDGDGGTAPAASAPADPTSEPSDPQAPRSDVTVTAIDSDVRRGLPLHLQGQVSQAGAPCSHLRVDVLLTGPALQSGVVVGSISTDDQGHFDGAVVIPRDFSLGDYDLLVATPGDARCAPGRTR
ncbi:MAG: transglutaminase-like domain-containing protein [Byssovorax sp.]